MPQNDALRNFAPNVTPQTEPVSTGVPQVKNNAGGYVFQISDWKQLERFLILGTEGGTYYTSEKKLTADNAQVLLRCIQTDGAMVVDMVLTLDRENRAPKMNPLIFALAATLATGNVEAKHYAEVAVQKVCRTGYHLYLLATYVKVFKNIGGRVTKRTFSTWFTSRNPNDLAYQFVKYRQREGWTMRDLLNLSHPKSSSFEQNAVLKWAIDMAYGNPVTIPTDVPLLVAFDEIQKTTSERAAVQLMSNNDLPWEALPDRWMSSAAVWEATLYRNIGYTALLRQLPRLTNLGVVKDLSGNTDRVCTLLTNPAKIEGAHVHPLSILIAMKQYSTGHGDRGNSSWTPVRAITDALNSAFYEAFNYVEPTGKNHYIGMDVSGSMTVGRVAGSSLTPREGAAAMAMSIARSEKNWVMYGFCDRMVEIDISPQDRLDTVIRKVDALDFGRTDCSLPMLDAMERGLDVDVFSIWTDSETYAGGVHPFQALENYRAKSGRNSKLVVCAMTSTGFSIANPVDPGMLDIVGMDASVPALISSFAS